MNYRDLGSTGVRVSEIGFGCGGNAGLMVRGTPVEQREAIHRALELGVNYFDQAPDYGDGLSETNLGRALKDLGAHPYITTKVEVRPNRSATIPATQEPTPPNAMITKVSSDSDP